jgi:hypothetical protein
MVPLAVLTGHNGHFARFFRAYFAENGALEPLQDIAETRVSLEREPGNFS